MAQRTRTNSEMRNEGDKKEGSSVNKAFWNCSYLPLELPLAVGLIPVRMMAQNGPTPLADRFLPANLCSYARSFLEESLKEEGGLFLLCDCCDAVRRLADALEYEFPGKVMLLYLPRSPEYFKFFREELKRLQDFLLQITARDLDQEKILEAKERVASRRRYFQEIRALAREGLIRPLDYFQILKAMNDFSQNMEPAKAGSQGKARVFVLGNNLDDPAVWEAFEELDLRIVGDDLCYGEKQAEIFPEFQGEDYLEALALSYLSRPPCPRMRNLKERLDDLLNKIQARRVNGVIIFPTKYCDSFFYDLPLLRTSLKEKNIPFLILEQDYSQRPLEQLKTRIEVMLEKGEHR